MTQHQMLLREPSLQAMYSFVSKSFALALSIADFLLKSLSGPDVLFSEFRSFLLITYMKISCRNDLFIGADTQAKSECKLTPLATRRSELITSSFKGEQYIL